MALTETNVAKLKNDDDVAKIINNISYECDGGSQASTGTESTNSNEAIINESSKKAEFSRAQQQMHHQM